MCQHLDHLADGGLLGRGDEVKSVGFSTAAKLAARTVDQGGKDRKYGDAAKARDIVGVTTLCPHECGDHIRQPSHDQATGHHQLFAQAADTGEVVGKSLVDGPASEFRISGMLRGGPGSFEATVQQHATDRSDRSGDANGQCRQHEFHHDAFLPRREHSVDHAKQDCRHKIDA